MKLTENLYIQRVHGPVSGLGSTIVPATYIDAQPFEEFAFILVVGATDRTTTTIQVLQATSAAGAGSKNVAGAVNTTFAATDDNKWAAVQVQNEQLDKANGFRYVAVQPATAGGAADLACVLFVGIGAKNKPVTQTDMFTDVMV